MSAETARLAIRAILDAKGATWVAPDVVQPAGIYLELYGEQIRRRIFLIESGGEEMCLRPDLTAPAVRAAFALPKAPAIVAYDGLVFRRQLAGTSRESEFGQVGAEWLGEGAFDVKAEAEIIAAALQACGAAPRMRLGDVAVLRAFVDALGLAHPWPARLMRALARPGGLAALRAEPRPALDDQGAGLAEALATMPEDHAEAAVADLLNLARITSVGGRPLSEIAQRLRLRGALAAATPPSAAQYDLLDALTRIDAADGLAQTEKLAQSKVLAQPASAQVAVANAKARSDALAGVLPKDFAFAPGLGRSVSYYDGFVFELEAPALGDRASLGGGGRYDGLARALWPAGKKAPASLRAAGFALRPHRIAEAAR
ncbi:ATP phosphoribosyltransferase regulatory subunit [alpha proteobacterium U9-1i]|nr:ATP phosphoribosyltransferase regulatory subunit [alpha proteobacterium U9-1i]